MASKTKKPVVVKEKEQSVDENIGLEQILDQNDYVLPTKEQAEKNKEKGLNAKGELVIENANKPGYEFSMVKAKALTEAAVKEARANGLRVSMDDFKSPAFLAGVGSDVQLVGKILGECIKKHQENSMKVVTPGIKGVSTSDNKMNNISKPELKHNLYWKCAACGSEEHFDPDDSCCKRCGNFPSNITDLLYDKSEQTKEVSKDE